MACSGRVCDKNVGRNLPSGMPVGARRRLRRATGLSFAFTTKVHGKTQTLQLKAGPELIQLQEQVTAYREFRELCEQVVELSERICQVRPAKPESPEAGRKKNSYGSPGGDEPRGRRGGDRSGSLGIGFARLVRAVILDQVLNAEGRGYEGSRQTCPQGHVAWFVEHRCKQMLMVLGPVQVQRGCPNCQAGMLPRDEALDIVGSSFSPGVMCRVGAKNPFRSRI
jgi:hypothetical protein